MLDKTTVSPEGVAFAAAAYDDCIADLDEQLGKLVDELDRRGVLERTWLIITSDHGESFGEHAGVFCHGDESLRYRAARSTPHHSRRGAARRSRPSKRRSVCATWRRRSSTWPVRRPARHFPGYLWHGFGSSLGRWRRSSRHRPYRRSPRWSRTTRASAITGVLPKQLSPLGAVKDGEWSYIRREGESPREVVPPERRPERAAQPGRRSIRPDDPGADASSTGPPDRGASLARAIQ